ncbi:MAG: transglutaminase-like domain-containing protein [Gemmataceae bacterium]|nr:transglutaminase-like domain-containing protein [Gemmataceae bacterium]
MNLDTALTQLANDPSAPLDLAELALRLATDEYPQLDVEAYLAEIDGMAHEARRYLLGDLAARVTGLCRYLFHDMGFRGNVEEYYDPRNSYLNEVLDRRTGIPISLSAVAMGVGARAGLEVQGVGLPGHFIVKAILNGREELFDPFHGGRRLTPGDCETLVLQVTGQPFQATAEGLSGLPLGLIVTRMLNNLKGTYLREGDFVRGVRVMERLCRLHPNDPLQRRDLGTGMLHASQPGKAIEHLNAYLSAAPQASDAETVRQLLRTARRRVAEWN